MHRALPRTTLFALSTSALFALALTASPEVSNPTAPPEPAQQERAGTPATLYFGDVDGDGLDDALVIGTRGEPTLLLNLGAGQFEDVTLASGLGTLEFATCAMFADLDGDGDQDLFVGSSATRLWRNLGNALFEPLVSGIDHDLIDLSAMAVDHDKDGLADVHIHTEAGDLLYRNTGRGAFERVELPESDHAAQVLAFASEESDAADASFTTDDDTPARRRQRRWLEARRAASSGAPVGGSLDELGASSSSSAQMMTGSRCPQQIKDQATGNCLSASTVPTIGMLHPLSVNLNVNAAGRVGMGTLTPIGNLDVIHPSPRVRISGGNNETSTVSLLENNSDTSGFDLRYNGANNQFQIAARDGTSTPNPLITVTRTTGHVGIGTTAPETALNIKNGSLWINGNTGGNLPASAGRGLRFWHEGALDVPAIQATDWGLLAGIDLLIQPDGGNVGIGTTTPESLLHVGGGSGGVATPTAIQMDNTYLPGASWDKLKFYLYKAATESYGLGLGQAQDVQYWAGSSTTGLHRWFTSRTERMRLDAAGRLGLGSTAPNARIDISNVGGVDGTHMLGFGEGGSAEFFFDSRFLASNLNNAVSFSTSIGGQRDIMTWRADGNVGVGTTSPTAPLHVRRGNAATDDPAAVFEIENCGLPCGQPTWTEMARLWNRNSNGRAGLGFVVDSAATLSTVPQVYIGTGDAAEANDFRVATRVGTTLTDRLTIDGATGLVSVKQTLEIRGGADIVERFEASDEVEPGTVVVIDPENPGQLMRSTTAYDGKVAGVVSGAGGVNPGLCLSQDGHVEGDTLVAMNGRVYVKATAANGAIKPGDRLTTSDLAGHAMKATDSALCDGAVIGKAMTTLESGEGLVLVLVNLQ